MHALSNNITHFLCHWVRKACSLTYFVIILLECIKLTDKQVALTKNTMLCEPFYSMSTKGHLIFIEQLQNYFIQIFFQRLVANVLACIFASRNKLEFEEQLIILKDLNILVRFEQVKVKMKPSLIYKIIKFYFLM